jgi:peptide/nickel transport system substrate-binding protein
MSNRFTAAGILAFALAACSGRDKNHVEAPTGGTLVISVSGDPENLLPPLSSTVTSQIIGDLVYDHLAEIGDSLNTIGDEGFKPRLAKTWTWSADSLAIAFHLDSAARWHDGIPVRASDVVFTWKTYSNPVNGSPFTTAIAGIDSVTAPDTLTAVVWFKARSPMQFYDAVNTMSILPAHSLGDATGAALRSAALARAPIGSGRFRFVKWTAGQSIELAADTSNYRGRPGLDRVIMTIAPDFNTAITRLLGGEADMLEQISPANVAQVASDSSVSIVLSDGLDYNFVQLNLVDPKHRTRPHPLFGNRDLRRALTRSLDRRNIVRNAYDSLAVVAVGPTVRAYPTTDPTLRQLEFVPDAARRALDSLNWKDTDADGIRDRNGRKLEFTLSVPASSKARGTMAVLIQEQMRQMGVKVNIEQLDFAAFVDRETRRDFDAVLGGWHVEASPGGIRQTWGSAGSRAKNGTNYGSYTNPAFDAEVDSALAASTLASRRAHFTAAYQIIIDDAPAIWLAEPKRIMAIHKRVNTVGLRPDAWWANLADWTIPREKQIARDRAPRAR